MPNPITIGRIELATLQPLERGEQADLVRLSPIDRCERDYITIDIAHGHAESVRKTIDHIKQRLPKAFVIAGNVATPEAVDTVMKLGMAHPMGPLALADFIGLDTCLSVMQVLYEGLADSKYRPCPLLVKYVEAGWLGRKTQRGFYDYRGEKPVPTR